MWNPGPCSVAVGAEVAVGVDVDVDADADADAEDLVLVPVLEGQLEGPAVHLHVAKVNGEFCPFLQPSGTNALPQRMKAFPMMLFFETPLSGTGKDLK